MKRNNPQFHSSQFLAIMDVPCEVLTHSQDKHDMSRTRLVGVADTNGTTVKSKCTPQVLAMALGNPDADQVPLHRKGEAWRFVLRQNKDGVAERIDMVFDRETSMLNRKDAPDGIEVEFADDEQGSIMIKDYPATQGTKASVTLAQALRVLDDLSKLDTITVGLVVGTFKVKSVNEHERTAVLVKK
mgnify:CR=1 FL=1